MLSVMAQPDTRDGYLGNPRADDWLSPPPDSLAGWRIAFSPDLGYVDVAPDIAARVREAVEALQALGATIEEVDPGFDSPLEVFNTLWFAGASQVLERLDSAQQSLLDPDFLAIARRGAAIPLRDYLTACRTREQLIARMQGFHERYDLLVTPTMPIAPFEAGHNVPPGSRYREWMDWTPFSYPFNLTQQPAASLPCGLDDQGLPVGLHIIGPRFQDIKVLHTAQLMEKHMPNSFPRTPNL